MIKSFVFLVLILLSCKAFSQTGTVIDKATKQPLEACSVYFPDDHAGTTTSKDGTFSLKNYLSSHLTMQFSMEGYKALSITMTILDSNYVFELEPSHLHFHEVIVSASKGKLQNDNITHVERREMNELRSQGAGSLVQALASISGVEQRATGIGIGKPVIRGLSGNRIVVYAQDIRQENQQWGDEHGLGIGDLGIEAVEVIKGPSSLLYGSDALGGVLYFVEERYAKENKTEAYIVSNLQSNNQTINTTGAFKVNRNKCKINLFGGYTSAADFQVPSGMRARNSRFNETDVKAAFGYAYKKWGMHLRYSLISNHFGITEDSTMGKQTDRTPELPYQVVSNQALSFSNTIHFNRSALNMVLGYVTNDRKEFEDLPDSAGLAMRLNTSSFNVKWTWPFNHDRTHLVVGSQGMHQVNRNRGLSYLIPDGQINDLGVFALLNGSIHRVKYQGGVRLDYRNMTGKALTEDTSLVFAPLNRSFVNPNFSIGISYNTGKWTLRANIANGFRSPNFSELTSNGVHEGTKRYEVGNAGLRIENAIQADLSLDYNGEHLQWSLNPFVNRIQDYIYLQPTAQVINRVQVYHFLQTNATLYGGEAGMHYHPHRIHWLHLESNLSTVFAQDDRGKALPLIPQVNIRTTAKAEIDSWIKSVFIAHTYKFRQNRIAEFETTTPAYHLFNAGIQFQPEIRKHPVEMNLTVNNLFNTRYIDHLSRFNVFGIPNQGINANLVLRYTLFSGPTAR